MPPKKKPTVKKNAVTEESLTSQGSSAAQGAGLCDHVLLKLPLTDQQLDSILSSDNTISDVLTYTPTINDPEPYTPLDPFLIGVDTIVDDSSYPTEEKEDNNMNNGNSASCCGNRKKQKVCFWCCHDVGHMTYGMPTRYDSINKSFTMYGTFCSLECSAAYNFSVHLGSDRAWEIHSWIQMLGKRYGFKEPIRPAPSRYLLNMFDGPLSIDEFRAAHKGQTRTYVLNIPPLISVNSQMEIVNTSFIGKTISAPEDKTAPRTRKTLDAKLGLTIEHTEST